MNTKKEWLDDRFNNDGGNPNNNKHNDDDDDDDDHDSLFSIDSNDTLHNLIEFQSHRNSTGLEEAISFSYPLNNNYRNDDEDDDDNNDDDLEKIENSETAKRTKRITLSTLLEQDDLVPIFDGAGWAGTRVWSAAIWGIQYLIEEFIQNDDKNNEKKKIMSLCELGCGLGVPGMIWHQLGGDVVLSDQERIMSQLRQNGISNFKDTYVSSTCTSTCASSSNTNANSIENAATKTIHIEPLDWSREGYQKLLQTTGYNNKNVNGFDILLNCDCVYEPLYGKSWEYLVEVIDECLKCNPNCIVVTSVERRAADGIDDFVERMKGCDYVSHVEKVMEDKARKLELYITTGIKQSAD
jgi:hypothetical protein